MAFPQGINREDLSTRQSESSGEITLTTLLHPLRLQLAGEITLTTLDGASARKSGSAISHMAPEFENTNHLFHLTPLLLTHFNAFFSWTPSKQLDPTG